MKIEKAMYDLKQELHSKVINVVNQVLEEAQQELQATAPKDTGFYANNMKVERAEKIGSIIQGRVYNDSTVYTSDGREYSLGEILEYGTKPHLITPVNANYLHFNINGKDVFTKLVHHPGTLPQPHWQPVYDKSVIKLERLLK